MAALIFWGSYVLFIVQVHRYNKRFAKGTIEKGDGLLAVISLFIVIGTSITLMTKGG